MTTVEETTYSFGVPQQRRVLLGLSRDRFAGMSVGILALLVCLFVAHLGAASLLAAVPGAAYGFLSFEGRPLPEWLRPALRHGAARASGRADFRAPLVLPVLGRHTPTGSGPNRSRVKPARPVELAGIDFGSYREGKARVGMAMEAKRGTHLLTAVFAVDGYQHFALAEPEEKAQAIASWGSVLASSAVDRSPVSRVQWTERSIPDAGRQAQEWMAAHRGSGETTALADYERLLDAATPAARRHEVFVSVQVTSTHSERTRAVGQAAGEWRLFNQRLSQAGLRGRPLGPAELSELLSSWCDPERAAAIGAVGEPGRTRLSGAMPRARSARWDYLRVNGCLHRSLVVTAWPRVPVAANWLAPLLMDPCEGAVRTIALHLEPVPSSKAHRAAVAAVISKDSEDASRERHGFVSTALRRREGEDLAAHEEELASGYAEHRIACVVGITALDMATLRTATTSVVQAATNCRLEISELYGEQHEGWAATLPLCRLRFRRV